MGRDGSSEVGSRLDQLGCRRYGDGGRADGERRMVLGSSIDYQGLLRAAASVSAHARLQRQEQAMKSVNERRCENQKGECCFTLSSVPSSRPLDPGCLWVLDSSS